jgi:SulP family sulfate permease
MAERTQTRHLLLVFSAVNAIDVSALQGLRELNRGLKEQGVMLSLAEVKGPVMDKLRQTGILDEVEGKCYLSAHEAMARLSALTEHDFAI